MDTKTDDKLAGAREQGQAQFNSIKEMVEALRTAQDGNVVTNDRDEEQDVDSCQQRIQEDPLSVQVRGDWHAPGFSSDYGNADRKPVEYEILLCTGGPACRIVGTLSEHLEPDTAHLEVQDWFTPWVEIRPLVSADNYDSEPVLLEYARQFWFGE